MHVESNELNKIKEQKLTRGEYEVKMSVDNIGISKFENSFDNFERAQKILCGISNLVLVDYLGDALRLASWITQG